MTHVIPTPESKRHVLSKRTEASKRCHRIFLCRNGCRKAKLGKAGQRISWKGRASGSISSALLSPRDCDWRVIGWTYRLQLRNRTASYIQVLPNCSVPDMNILHCEDDGCCIIDWWLVYSRSWTLAACDYMMELTLGPSLENSELSWIIMNYHELLPAITQNSQQSRQISEKKGWHFTSRLRCATVQVKPFSCGKWQWLCRPVSDVSARRVANLKFFGLAVFVSGRDLFSFFFSFSGELGDLFRPLCCIHHPTSIELQNRANTTWKPGL